MAARTPRFAWINGATDPATVITASDEQSAFPARNIGDPSLAKTWRSKIGWTVTAGFNEKIDVSEGGTLRVATIASGYYQLGSDYAGAVQAALNGMPGAVNTYSCTYSATTHVFTIARASGAATVSLLWSTGANAAKSAGKDLGYNVAVDKTGSTSYPADYVSYQSRHYLDFNMFNQAAADGGNCSVDVVLGESDTIDFSEGGTPRVATVRPGHYTDQDAIVSELFSAIGAAAVSNTYGVTWDNTGNNQKFRIFRTSGAAAVSLLWGTGANKVKSIGTKLGWNAADATGSTDYLADNAVYGWPQVQVAVVRQHNMRFQGTVKLLGDVSQITSAAPASTQTLVGTDQIRIVTVTLEAYAYRRLLIEDVQNSDGFNELGVLYFGPYYESPSWLLGPGYSEQHDQLSRVFRADRGAIFQDKKPQAKLIAGTLVVFNSGKVSLQQLQDAVRLGGPFFFVGDPVGNLRGETFYVALTKAISFDLMPDAGGANPAWFAKIEMLEDLA